ncbi:dTMP kinase [Methanolacinia paynteri]|uniref:dTMP kinase n=1 Tax=Methanolacinia paynteri TaxID=230356 RepID=UPI00064E30C4|nr:dTMP kinase [Methanolacinia paynteri]
MLITIEGIDGTGKSTLVENLKGLLSDLDPVFTREPGSTWIGEAVRRGIAEGIDPVAEALLFTADHAAHLETVIRPNLANGKIIISDRYSDSRYAYQASTLKEILPDPMRWMKSIHEGWTVVPDLTFLLVIPVADAVERLNENRTHQEHFECVSTLEEVKNNYLVLAEEDPKRFVLVDASLDPDEIAEFVAGEIRKKAESKNKSKKR